MVKLQLIAIVIVFNVIMSKSHEHRLITKEHIVMHTNLILLFNAALYSITLVMNLSQNS